MRTFLLASAVACSSILGGCQSRPATSPTSATELREQADEWDRAIVRKDLKAISQNMAESFQHIDSQGRLSDKADFLAGITSEKLVIQPYEPQHVEIRFYGNAALITGTTRLHGSYDGKPFETHYRYTDVYAREAGTWRVVGVQTTEIEK